MGLCVQLGIGLKIGQGKEAGVALVVGLGMRFSRVWSWTWDYEKTKNSSFET